MVIGACVALAGCAGGSANSFAPALASRPVATSVLSTAMVGGGPAFIDATMHVVYVFDGDMNTPNFSNCTSGGAFQLAYKGRPLYTFQGDTSALVSAGNGLNEFGGIWHVARP